MKISTFDQFELKSNEISTNTFQGPYFLQFDPIDAIFSPTFTKEKSPQTAQLFVFDRN